MKAVVQRVISASVSVDGKVVSSTSAGLIVYLGVKRGDEAELCSQMAKKIANLRIFEDENGKMNKSILDVGGEIMLISQFTLLADPMHGNRPSYTDAESPTRANELYLLEADKLREYGLKVKTGVFGADMKIDNVGDGPVTIILEYN
ncbi:MAG: D-tyrosyl-tRNA(Tyr) deacylase [Clostridia bacterium]|nr:D-tyrosyl-tRNA(Tyr) deacylase [Clostridia bacterium]MBP5648536.1 D-tyrosyl-tRNA(Tyr) deacylase [Clostridia bacterium]